MRTPGDPVDKGLRRSLSNELSNEPAATEGRWTVLHDTSEGQRDVVTNAQCAGGGSADSYCASAGPLRAGRGTSEEQP